MAWRHCTQSNRSRGRGKTEKLFVKLGIRSTDDLIHYYPRDYDAYEPPVRLCQLVPGKKWSVTGMLMQAPDVKRRNARRGHDQDQGWRCLSDSDLV